MTIGNAVKLEAIEHEPRLPRWVRADHRCGDVYRQRDVVEFRFNVSTSFESAAHTQVRKPGLSGHRRRRFGGESRLDFPAQPEGHGPLTGY